MGFRSLFTVSVDEEHRNPDETVWTGGCFGTGLCTFDIMLFFLLSHPEAHIENNYGGDWFICTQDLQLYLDEI